MFIIYDGEKGVQVGTDQVVVGGFEEPLKLIVNGIFDAIIIADGGEISEDKILWTGRIATDFAQMYKTIYVKPLEDLNQKITIKVEQA